MIGDSCLAIRGRRLAADLFHERKLLKRRGEPAINARGQKRGGQTYRIFVRQFTGATMTPAYSALPICMTCTESAANPARRNSDSTADAIFSPVGYKRSNASMTTRSYGKRWKNANGEVLVVDGAAYLGGARWWGHDRATCGNGKRLVGVIIYGAIRDANAVATLDIGVKALGTNPKRSGKNGTGRVNVPVSFGTAIFSPGHWLYSDDDGILVSAEELKITP